MIMQRFGIFGKVFLYTLLFLLIAIGSTVLVFAQQFKDFYDYLQLRQYATAFEPLKMKIIGSGDLKEVIQTANEFHDKNQSFAFSIETKDGDIVYKTFKGAGDIPQQKAFKEPGMGAERALTIIRKDPGADKTDKGITIALNNGLVVRTLPVTDSTDLYKEFSNKALFIAFLLICFSIAGAIFFARGITNPIKKLAEDTRRMSSLEPVAVPVDRRDEVGQLAADVHKMYEKLKQTISKLESEVLREREMEENQRYFFSAASHELKTPIAAASALLEGMIAGIGDYKNHPKYLRECLQMMNTQNRTIMEILELVSLSDERITPQKENVNLMAAIETLLPEYCALAEKKNQNVTVCVPETVSCRTDKKMLGRVLSNVLMNAIQNSPDGEEVRIWSEEESSGTVRLSMLNTNASIEEEMKAKLFEPFFRADTARSRKAERSGLGLTIVKRILDSMGIPFELTAVGPDVVFRLELPVTETAQPSRQTTD